MLSGIDLVALVNVAFVPNLIATWVPLTHVFARVRACVPFKNYRGNPSYSLNCELMFHGGILEYVRECT